MLDKILCFYRFKQIYSIYVVYELVKEIKQKSDLGT